MNDWKYNQKNMPPSQAAYQNFISNIFKKNTAKVHLSAKVTKQKQYNHQEPQGFLT